MRPQIQSSKQVERVCLKAEVKDFHTTVIERLVINKNETADQKCRGVPWNVKCIMQ